MEIWQFDLRQGNSSDPRHGACLLDAVSWFEYGTLGDHPACVCPVIASFARTVNDFLPDDQRQRLKPFILRLPGTVDPASERARVTFLMWQAIRGFAPLALEAAASVAVGNHPAILRRHAAKLREQTDVTDARYAAAEASDAARAANTRYGASDAWVASAASDAASFASYAFRAASYASAAIDAISAARAASYASSAAWGASYAAGAIYDLSIATLDGVLQIGRQAEPVLPARIRAANRSFEIARA